MRSCGGRIWRVGFGGGGDDYDDDGDDDAAWKMEIHVDYW